MSIDMWITLPGHQCMTVFFYSIPHNLYRKILYLPVRHFNLVITDNIGGFTDRHVRALRRPHPFSAGAHSPSVLRMGITQAFPWQLLVRDRNPSRVPGISRWWLTSLNWMKNNWFPKIKDRCSKSGGSRWSLNQRIFLPACFWRCNPATCQQRSKSSETSTIGTLYIEGMFCRTAYQIMCFEYRTTSFL